MDHFEVRGWRCVHRHWYVTQLSYLFCSRLRVQYDDNEVALTVEQVRSVVNVWIRSVDPAMQLGGKRIFSPSRSSRLPVSRSLKFKIREELSVNSPAAWMALFFRIRKGGLAYYFRKAVSSRVVSLSCHALCPKNKSSDYSDFAGRIASVVRFR